jgi:hypothetical protein
MRNIKLSEISMYNKFQLALKAGYKVIKVDNRYKIDGADNYIYNDFRSIDDILKLIL